METGVTLNGGGIDEVDIASRVGGEILLEQKLQTIVGIPAAAEMSKHPIHAPVGYFRIRIGSYMIKELPSLSISTASFKRSSESM